MKPARKLLIIHLAVLLIFSSVNTTAFAVKADDNSSNAAATDTITTEQDLNPTAQNNSVVSASSALTITTAVNVPSLSAATVEQAVDSPVPASVTITDTQPPVESNPGVILTIGQEIAVSAIKYNGYKYVYGAASPSVGFDCSGFAYYIYNQFGYALPRTARLQYRNGTTVEKTDLQPGDLVFFATNGGKSVSHVGFYIGNNQFIHAATSRHGVMISSLDNSYWTKAWVGAKRIVANEISTVLN